MAGSSRAARVHAFARDLETRFGVRFDAAYDTGPTWRLDWADGPSTGTVRALADAADLAGAQLRLTRTWSLRAIALTAIRLAATGQFGRNDAGSTRSGPRWTIESALHDLDFPERSADDLQARMLDTLIPVAKSTTQSAWAEYQARPQRGFVPGTLPPDVEDTAATLVRDRGLGWLLEQRADAGDDLPPLILPSARYRPRADATHALARRERAEPIPIHTAVTAALTDDPLTGPGALALLALLPELRADLARTEAAAIAAAHRPGLSPDQLTATLEPAAPQADQDRPRARNTP